MPWIRTIPVGQASGELKELYDAAIRRAGRVFGIVRTMSLAPAILEASMDLYLAIMFAPHGLTRSQREMVAVVVSRANQCRY